MFILQKLCISFNFEPETLCRCVAAFSSSFMKVKRMDGHTGINDSKMIISSLNIKKKRVKSKKKNEKQTNEFYSPNQTLLIINANVEENIIMCLK